MSEDQDRYPVVVFRDGRRVTGWRANVLILLWHLGFIAVGFFVGLGLR